MSPASHTPQPALRISAASTKSCDRILPPNGSLPGSSGNAQKDKFVSFMAALRKYSSKLDPYIERFGAMREAWAFNTAVDYTESEALLRLHQTRDFVLEVKDFL